RVVYSHRLTIVNVPAYVVTGKPRSSAFQHIALSLKEILLRQMDDFESLMAKPCCEVYSLATPDLVAEVADDKFVLPDETGVGRKDHIRQPRFCVDDVDIDGASLLKNSA